MLLARIWLEANAAACCVVFLIVLPADLTAPHNCELSNSRGFDAGGV